jgi:superfamily II DNA or RNA helicase
MDYPRHYKTRSSALRGLLEGLKSFRELEGRISELPGKRERGDAFEVFAEAYLATVAIEKAKHVWPGANVPHSLRTQLALTIGDKGVDGIFETQLGAYHAYQVKFRTGRPSLTWDELSTFIGLADRVKQRVLFTNCDRFAEVVKQRIGFYAITGRDLDLLEPQDFLTIRTWLEDARIERSLKIPLPHQTEALDNILPALCEHDRATALMACGTGKTLVALWVCERLGAQNILVLVPSLALLRQTLHEWVRQTSWPLFAHLCVCSDPTVKPENDGIVLRPEDLDFPVSTDSEQVRAFLGAKFSGVKVVLSTYQSAHVVAEGMKHGETFDFAIFDEAHKTAGPEGAYFGFALKDERLLVKRRLFLTATPRHYDLYKHGKDGDAQLVYSMDVPRVYGPVAHELSFGEAARRGIICGYKVIISVVTSAEVDDYILRHGEVTVKHDVIKARHVANQLALSAAIAKHDVTKIFTFHRSVASAKAFSGDGSEGIDNYLSGFNAFHVNGSMSTAVRENIIEEFRASSKAVISNARCLTEGVDVPAVDMVAFLTPKRSRVDIVQATGRAMRKSAGKATGYVLVPLFVEQAKSETIDEALTRSEFDEVWSVLRAMQEQDDVLATAIKEMQEERGRRKGFDDTRFREIVEVLGPQISLEVLRKCITTVCLNVLGSTWDERLGELKAFKEQYGHSNVPTLWGENQALGNWLGTQRKLYKSGKLTEDRIRRLDSVGFTWDPLDAEWDLRYNELKVHQTLFGNSNAPVKNSPLGNWMGTQRALYRSRRLSEERVRRLTEIGFKWAIFDEGWDSKFAELKAYEKQFGNTNVPLRWPENPPLGHWVSAQRMRFKSGELSEERTRRLSKIGFAWDTLDAEWDANFAELKAYQKEFGNCAVPTRYKEDSFLGQWVSTQRAHYASGKLSKERVRDLTEIGFEWHSFNAAWDIQLAELEAYKGKFGNCAVPNNYKENAALGHWVSMQSRLRKAGKLSAQRVRRLDQIGFEWERRSAAWDASFAALKLYRDRLGNCDVPNQFTENKALGVWVATQRASMKSGKLSDERVRQLSEIGFTWDSDDGIWNGSSIPSPCTMLIWSDLHLDMRVGNNRSNNISACVRTGPAKLLNSMR